MIKKIKVTKQEIRTYTDTNDIKSYSYDVTFLNSLLTPAGKYEVSTKNSNVTWYQLAEFKAAEDIVEDDLVKELDVDLEGLEDVIGVEAIDVLESEGYDITDSAKEAIIENYYSVSDLKSVAKNNKITGTNIKKLS